MMKLNKLFLIFLLSITNGFAQDINTTQVKVVEGFKPTIPEANRLNENATFADTIKKDRTQNYTVISTELKSNFKTRPLKAAIVKADRIPKLYGTKVGLGFGNVFATKASFMHNSPRSHTLSYGIIANHFANKYEAPASSVSYVVKNSRNTMHLYGKIIKKSHIFIANLDYDRRTAVYHLPLSIMSEERFFRNRFAYTKLSFFAVSTEKEPDKLQHNTSFFVSDLNEFSENHIHLSTDLSKTINGYPINLEIDLDDYLNYNNPDISIESIAVQSFQIFPSVSLSRYGVDFDLGIELHYLSDDSPIGIAPAITVTKELVKDLLLVYGGFRHSDQRHTFKSLSDENPYIHSSQTNQSILGQQSIQQNLQTSDTDELYVAIRNVLGHNEVFDGSLAYGTVQSFAHFVEVTNENYNRFIVDYVDVVNQFHANVNYDREINNIFSLNIKADYYNWDKEVYYKSNFSCSVSTPLNLRNKIKITPSTTYNGIRMSQNSKLPSLLHADLGMYYSYSTQLSAYLQLNNITNSKQDIWIGYKEVGFNCVLGLNYSF